MPLTPQEEQELDYINRELSAIQSGTTGHAGVNWTSAQPRSENPMALSTGFARPTYSQAAPQYSMVPAESADVFAAKGISPSRHDALLKMGSDWVESSQEDKTLFRKNFPEEAAKYERAADFGLQYITADPQMVNFYPKYGAQYPHLWDLAQKKAEEPFGLKHTIPAVLPDAAAAVGAGIGTGLTGTPLGGMAGAAIGGAAGKLGQMAFMGPGYRGPMPETPGEAAMSVLGEAGYQAAMEGIGSKVQEGGQAILKGIAGRNAEWALPVGVDAAKMAKRLKIPNLTPSQLTSSPGVQLMRQAAANAIPFTGGGALAQRELRQGRAIAGAFGDQLDNMVRGLPTMTDADFGILADSILRENRDIAKEATAPAFKELGDALSPKMVKKQVEQAVEGGMLDASGKPMTKMVDVEVPEGGFRMPIADIKKDAKALMERMGTPKTGTPQKSIYDDMTYLASLPDDLTYDEAKTAVQSLQHLARKAEKSGTINASTGKVSQTVGQLVDRLDSSIAAISPELVDKHRALMAEYSAIKKKFDSDTVIKISKEALGRGNPEGVIDYIIHADTPTRMKAIKDVLTASGDESAWNLVRAKYLERLAGDVINPDTKLLDAKALTRKLDAIGPEALKVLLGDQSKVQTMNEIAQVARVIDGAAKREVVGSLIMAATQVGGGVAMLRNPDDPKTIAIGGAMLTLPALISTMFLNPRLARMFIKVGDIPATRTGAKAIAANFLKKAAAEAAKPQTALRAGRAIGKVQESRSEKYDKTYKVWQPGMRTGTQEQ